MFEHKYSFDGPSATSPGIAIRMSNTPQARTKIWAAIITTGLVPFGGCSIEAADMLQPLLQFSAPLADHANVAAVSSIPDGGIAVVGTVKKYENAGENNSGLFVVRFNATGEILWNKTLGSYRVNKATAVAGGADGSIVVGGVNREDCRPSLLCSATWLLRFDRAGNFLWSPPCSSSRRSCTSNGGHLMVSSEAEVLEPGAIAIASNGEIGIAGSDGGALRLLRFDSDGHLILDQGIATGDDTWGNAILSLPNGDFIVAGNAYFTIPRVGSRFLGRSTDVVAGRFGASGEVRWGNRYLLQNNEKVNAASRAGNRIVLAGSVRSIPSRASDVWLVWLDENGQQLETAAFDFNKTPDEGKAVFGNSDGSILVAATTRLDNESGIWLFRVDVMGDKTWEAVHPTFGTAFAFTKAGDLIVGGADGHRVFIKVFRSRS
jgi:hypothetical protein